MAQSTVAKLYQSVIEDVISNVREAFIDEGLDEQSLVELKQLWEKKVVESKATEREPEPFFGKSVDQPLPVPSISSRVTSKQATVSMENLISPSVFQYVATSGSVPEEQKPTVSTNTPSRLAFTFPARVAQAGLQTLVATTPSGNTVQLPPQIVQVFQRNVLQSQAGTPPNPVQQSNQQISGIQYQVLTADQLQAAAPHFTVTIPVTASQKQTSNMLQVDGANDTSDEEDLSYSEGDEEDDDEADHDAVEDEPLNSDDDEKSEEDIQDVFDTDNVIVCQYDKIGRSKNRWKFNLKDGIMNLKGKDYVFQKALGDSEW